MAYIHKKISEIFDVTNSIVPQLPEHETDDILICFMGQDGGGTAFATVSSGWANVGGQARSGASRQAVFWKKATSASETSPTFTAHNESWVVTTLSIRDVDPTTAIDGSSRTDWNSTGSVVCPSLTTTTDDCLVLYAMHSDGNKYAYVQDPIDLTFAGKSRYSSSGGSFQAVGYKQQFASGAVPSTTFDHEVSSEGGSAFTIALRNKSGGSRANYQSQSHNHALRLGLIDSIVSTDPSLLISTINGMSVLTNTLSTTNTVSFTDEEWGSCSSFTVNIAGTDQWIGRNYPLTASYDFSGKNSSVTFQISDANSNRYGDEGCIIALVDGSGNWAAYQLLDRVSTQNGTTYTFHFSPGLSSVYDESATSLDESDVTDIMFLLHRVGGSTSNQSALLGLFLDKEKTICIGGGSGDPCSPTNLTNLNNNWGAFDQSKNQGSGQGLSRNGIQFGDGSSETYVDFSATSYEIDPPSDLNILVANSMPFIIYASANDTMKFESCVISTPLTQSFEIHASSSTSATYSFTGANIIGWDITWRSGITCNQANISNCTITQNGGTFDQCNFVNSSVTASDLDEMDSCDFVSGGSGHAVELSSLGSGTFTWNCTDSGYAATDGSAGDETIYVNVGSGTLTINVASGASTPTIRTAGATVTVLVGQVTTEFTVKELTGGTVLENARVYLIAASGGPLTVGTVIFNTLTNASGIVSDTRSLASDQPVEGWIRMGTSSPYYKQTTIAATISSANGLTQTFQLVDDE